MSKPLFRPVQSIAWCLILCFVLGRPAQSFATTETRVHRLDIIAGQYMKATALAATHMFRFPVCYEDAPAQEGELDILPSGERG